jgi:hypothetical protein
MRPTVAVTDQFCSKCFNPLERPSFWRRLGAWFKSAAKPGTHTIILKKNVTLQTIDKDKVKHVYHSLAEVPPELRAEFEKLEADAIKSLDANPQSIVVSSDVQQPQPLQQEKKTVIRKNFQEFKFKDASGKEQVYHSLDEMPPQTRAIFEKLRGQLNLPE